MVENIDYFRVKKQYWLLPVMLLLLLVSGCIKQSSYADCKTDCINVNSNSITNNEETSNYTIARQCYDKCEGCRAR